MLRATGTLKTHTLSLKSAQPLVLAVFLGYLLILCWAIWIASWLLQLRRNGANKTGIILILMLGFLLLVPQSVKVMISKQVKAPLTEVSAWFESALSTSATEQKPAKSSKSVEPRQNKPNQAAPTDSKVERAVPADVGSDQRAAAPLAEAPLNVPINAVDSAVAKFKTTARDLKQTFRQSGRTEHIVLFFVIALSLGIQGQRPLLFTIQLTLFAGATELMQHFSPGRTPDLLDFVANLLGIWGGLLITLGLLTCWQLLRKYSGPAA